MQANLILNIVFSLFLIRSRMGRVSKWVVDDYRDSPSEALLPSQQGGKIERGLDSTLFKTPASA